MQGSCYLCSSQAESATEIRQHSQGTVCLFRLEIINLRFLLKMRTLRFTHHMEALVNPCRLKFWQNFFDP